MMNPERELQSWQLGEVDLSREREGHPTGAEEAPEAGVQDPPIQELTKEDRKKEVMGQLEDMA